MNHIIVAFATHTWQLYVGMAFGVLSFSVTTICRSMISKFVEPHEVGKVFAVVAAIQVLKAVFLKNYLAKPYDTKNLYNSALPLPAVR